MQHPNQAYSQLTFINEDQEPCLKSIKKKIRNLIKKLQDIKDLQKKDYLQPEQVEKINRKQKFISERDKLIDFAVLYRGILIENRDYYEKKNFQQLDQIANAFTFLNFEKDTNEESLGEVSQLRKLTNPDYDEEHWKIKKERNFKILKSFVDNPQNNEKVVEMLNKNPIKLHKKNEQSLTKVEVQPESSEKVEGSFSELAKESVSIKQNDSSEKIPSNLQLESKKVIENKEEKKEVQNETKESENREKNDSTIKESEKKKRNRKPRNSKKQKIYEPKEEEANNYEDQPKEIGNFKKDQIEKLEDEGFIFVGKPKPKAHDQKKWHEHEHGRKSNRTRK